MTHSLRHLLTIILCGLIVVGGLALYRFGKNAGTTKCQAQIMQMSAEMQQRSVAAEQLARRETVMRNMDEKRMWLKNNRRYQ